MQQPALAWQPLVDAVRRAHAHPTSPDDASQDLAALGWRRLVRGRHWVYAVPAAGRTVCLKAYKVDGRGSPEREWTALSLLARQDCAHTPEPLFFDPAPPVPVLVMGFAAGQGLGKRALDRPALEALAAALADLHRVAHAGAPEDARRILPVLDHSRSVPQWITQKRDLLRSVAVATPSAPPDSPGEAPAGPAVPEALRREAAALADPWLAGPDADLLAGPVVPVFTHCDGNLNNALWDGHRVTLVDFEYAGWRDRAFDVADLVEQNRAWCVGDGFDGTAEEDWDWFAQRFDFTPAERAHLAAARRAMALFWLLYHCARSGTVPPGLPERLAAHLPRVRRQLAAA